MRRAILLVLCTLPAWLEPVPSGPEDESVFVKNLRPDQHESLLYVWTSDADAKQPDFLTVVDADPKSPGYGKILTTVPTGSTVDNEAHHFGYTVNADHLRGRAGLEPAVYLRRQDRPPPSHGHQDHSRPGRHQRVLGPAHLLRRTGRRDDRDARVEGRHRSGRTGPAR